MPLCPIAIDKNINDRLKRLRESLEDIDGSYDPFGFGILRPSPAAWISPEVWASAEEANDPTDHEFEHNMRYWDKILIDPDPSRLFCIRWWGDLDGIRAFQEWGVRVFGYFRKHPDWKPELYVPDTVMAVPESPGPCYVQLLRPFGHYWTLNAIAMYAVDQLASLSDEHPFVDTADLVNYSEIKVIPTKMYPIGSPPTLEDYPVDVLYFELEEDAMTLGFRFLDHIISREMENLPPLEFCPRPESDETILDYVDGSYVIRNTNGSYYVPEDYKLFFRLFVDKIYKEVPGQPVGWRAIQETLGSNEMTDKKAGKYVTHTICLINKAMQESLGRPIGNRWILSKSKIGAYLNTSVEWKADKKITKLVRSSREVRNLINPKAMEETTYDKDRKY